MNSKCGLFTKAFLYILYITSRTSETHPPTTLGPRTPA